MNAEKLQGLLEDWEVCRKALDVVQDMRLDVPVTTILARFSDYVWSHMDDPGWMLHFIAKAAKRSDYAHVLLREAAWAILTRTRVQGLRLWDNVPAPIKRGFAAGDYRTLRQQYVVITTAYKIAPDRYQPIMAAMCMAEIDRELYVELSAADIANRIEYWAQDCIYDQGWQPDTYNRVRQQMCDIIREAVPHDVLEAAVMAVW